MYRATIAIDIDGVVADTHLAWYAQYNKDYHDTLTPDMVTEWDLHKFVKPECGTKIYEYLTPKLYKKVQPNPDALDYVKFARILHRIIFVTSVYHEAGAKFDWLKRFGFFDGVDKPAKDYIECNDKSLITADMLIDDGPHNFEGFKGFPLLFNQPWNKNNKGWARAMNFDEVSYFTLAQPWLDKEK